MYCLIKYDYMQWQKFYATEMPLSSNVQIQSLLWILDSKAIQQNLLFKIRFDLERSIRWQWTECLEKNQNGCG